MTIDDVFGSHPQRPDHPDFWKLSDIVLELDASMYERGATHAEDVISQKAAEVGDSESITYMAVQRAMRALGVQSRQDLVDKRNEIALYATVYLEAFIVGVRFAYAKQGE